MWDFFQKIGPMWTVTLILTISGFVFTLWTFWGTVERYWFLRSHNLNGNRKRYAVRVMRHEAFRVIGHILCIVGVWLSAHLVTTGWYELLSEEAQDTLHYRDWLFLSISLKMTLNSILDLYDRRKGYRGFLLTNKKRPSNETRVLDPGSSVDFDPDSPDDADHR